MAIDSKKFFRNNTTGNEKSITLERLESRRWVKEIVFNRVCQFKLRPAIFLKCMCIYSAWLAQFFNAKRVAFTIFLANS